MSSNSVKTVLSGVAALFVIASTNACTTTHHEGVSGAFKQAQLNYASKSEDGLAYIIHEAFKDKKSTSIGRNKKGNLTACTKVGDNTVTYTLARDGASCVVSIVPPETPDRNFNKSAGADNPKKTVLHFDDNGNFISGVTYTKDGKMVSIYLNGAEEVRGDVARVVNAVKLEASAVAWESFIKNALENSKPTIFSRNPDGNPAGIFRGKNMDVVTTLYSNDKSEHTATHVLVFLKASEDPSKDTSMLSGRVESEFGKVHRVMFVQKSGDDYAKIFAYAADGRSVSIPSKKLTKEQQKILSQRAADINSAVILKGAGVAARQNLKKMGVKVSTPSNKK